MKINNECVPCLLKRIIFEAEQSTKDKKLQTKIIKQVCNLLSDLYSPDACSAEIATKAHKLTYDLLTDKDPYKQLKKKSNEVASSLLPTVENLIKNSDDRLKTSMICSVIGNILDFGIEGGSKNPENLNKIFNTLYTEGLGYDDYLKVKNLLKKTQQLVFFTDNCGEIVFDKILCREIKHFNQSIRITLVVRGEPVISDATIEDAESLHFEDVVDDLLTTGCFAVGVDFQRLPGYVKKVLDTTDLILCKGMANYESFSETGYKPVVYLLRTKCAPIASSMGLPLNVNAIKLYQ
jgi:damage-control phosphatase, subfamily I